MDSMPRTMLYTIAAFAFVAIGLPLFMFVLKAGTGILFVAVVGGVAAYLLYSSGHYAIDRFEDL